MVFNNQIGIWSRSQDFVRDDVITFLTSDSETTLNCSRDNPWNMGAVGGNWSVDGENVWMSYLFSLKLNEGKTEQGLQIDHKFSYKQDSTQSILMLYVEIYFSVFLNSIVTSADYIRCMSSFFKIWFIPMCFPYNECQIWAHYCDCYC